MIAAQRPERHVVAPDRASPGTAEAAVPAPNDQAEAGVDDVAPTYHCTLAVSFACAPRLGSQPPPRLRRSGWSPTHPGAVARRPRSRSGHLAPRVVRPSRVTTIHPRIGADGSG